MDCLVKISCVAIVGVRLASFDDCTRELGVQKWDTTVWSCVCKSAKELSVMRILAWRTKGGAQSPTPTPTEGMIEDECLLVGRLCRTCVAVIQHGVWHGVQEEPLKKTGEGRNPK